MPVEPLEVIKIRSHRYSRIMFIKDASENLFVVKQIKETSIESKIAAISETLACATGESINVPINHVTLLTPQNHPALYQLPKLRRNQPATLHTYVDGNPAKQINIQPPFRGKYTKWYKEYGQLPPEKRGLTKAVLRNMSKDPQLPTIAALDTFVGNNDRCDANLLYNEKSKRFFAIDMGESFKFNLCKEALRHVEEFFENPLPEAETQALIIYLDTMATLVAKWSLEITLQQFDDLAHSVGLYQENQPQQTDIDRKIATYKKIIKESYQDAKKLAQLRAKLTASKRHTIRPPAPENQKGSTETR